MKLGYMKQIVQVMNNECVPDAVDIQVTDDGDIYVRVSNTSEFDSVQEAMLDLGFELVSGILQRTKNQCRIEVAASN